MADGRQSIWLRCEKKALERRSALTPTTARALLDAGFNVVVEEDEQRIFRDSEFKDVGCTMVANNSWPAAPLHTPIIGLKELELSESPLDHIHIHFAHCYKNQEGWAQVLQRFTAGGGTLYDLEFLTDDKGRRVAAFGYHAGFAGAAAGVLAYSARLKGETIGHLHPYNNEKAMTDEVAKAISNTASSTKVLVMGALGRCGRGAVELFRKVGVKEENILKWDMAETASGGPFSEICAVDIFVNCIYLNSFIPPFLTTEFLRAQGASRKLSVIVDVSCDTTNPFNPIPIYKATTSFDVPTLQVEIGSDLSSLSVIAIDHLPSLLPREASEQFSSDLLPSLLELPSRHTSRVWSEAESLFTAKAASAQSGN